MHGTGSAACPSPGSTGRPSIACGRPRAAAAGLDRLGGGVMGAEIGGLRLEDFYAYQAAFPRGAAAVAGGG